MLLLGSAALFDILLLSYDRIQLDFHDWEHRILSGSVALQRQRYGVRAWTSECQFTTGDMLASLYALRDLVASHVSHDVASSHNSDHEPVRRSLLNTAQSLLGDVHYGGRVKAASDRQVLAAMVSFSVLPVFRLLLQAGDGGDLGALLRTNTASVAKVALQLPADRCHSIKELLEAVNCMPGLESTLELIGVDVPTDHACQQQAC